MTTIGAKQPIIIFYCSVSEDQALLEELDKHLATIRRSGQIVTLYNSQILPGGMQEQTTIQQFLSADLILLLVSPDALSSTSWYKMMQYAMERHRKGKAHVIPILIRQVYYGDEPFTMLKMLPADGKAIASHSDPNSIFSEIARSIHKVVKEMHSLSTVVSPTIKHTSTSSQKLRMDMFQDESNSASLPTLDYTDLQGLLFTISSSHCGSFIASADSDDTVQVWNNGSPILIYHDQFCHPARWVTSVLCCYPGKHIASSS